jgi:uncharacterized membrane protein
MGRKEVAAALPGVAIAAALVPPLGVIGYGTATGQLDIAGGSLLLFSTNLIAIVVAAAVVFLLLGFRPPRARLRGQVRAKLLISLLALLLISIPLASFSVSAIDQITSQREVETILSDAVESDTTMITEVLVERQEEGFLVLATIYATEDLAPDYIAELETHLSNQVGEPVTLHATVLRAMLLPEEDETLPPTPTPML